MTYGHDTFASMTRIKGYIKQYKLQSRLAELDLKMYESINDRSMLLLHLAFYEQDYINKGYKLLSKKKGLYYKVEINLGLDHRLHVNLVNKKKQKLLVGIFLHQEGADSFVKHYFNEGVLFPICRLSVATRSYMIKDGEGKLVEGGNLR